MSRPTKYTHSFSIFNVRGFGLIELLVTISIMALVSAVILTRHRGFDSAVLLRNQAYEVAFTIREAQNLAVSSVFTGGSGVENFRDQYGVHFDTTSQVYMIFRDIDGDGYDASEQIGQPLRLDPRFSFLDFTNSSDTSLTGNTVDILFQRPNFDAKFDPASDGTVRIVLMVTDSPSNTRTVEVNQTGNIAVLETPPVTY